MMPRSYRNPMDNGWLLSIRCRPHNNLLAKLFECLSSRVAVLFTICQINSRSCSYRVYIGHIAQLQSELSTNAHWTTSSEHRADEFDRKSDTHWYRRSRTDSRSTNSLRYTCTNCRNYGLLRRLAATDLRLHTRRPLSLSDIQVPTIATRKDTS